jgi:ABC-2 type transport system ATP-binding protein
MLSVESVTLGYAGRPVLEGISASVRPGEIVILIGPNGAGKSTLMRILATITKPNSGMVTWNEIDILRSPNRLRAVLGYLPQDFGVYPNLNAIEFLEYIAAAKGLDRKAARERIQEILEVVNLTDARKRQLGSYSGGMKQRVGIAQALLNDPDLLIVDEPTAGLDPEERVRFRNLLSELSGDRIVILSTHIVSDVEACATLIALISRGQLITSALPEELLQSVEGKVWERVVGSAEVPALRQQYLTSSITHRSDGVHLRIVAEESPGAQAVAQTPTLEDAYLYWISGKPGETK